MFWRDRWIGHTTLATKYWNLYSIANDQSITVCEAWDGTNLKISFRRCFSLDMLAEWNDLFNDIKNIVLVDKRDTVCWDFVSKGVYIVKSFYNIINFRGVSPGNSVAI